MQRRKKLHAPSGCKALFTFVLNASSIVRMSGGCGGTDEHLECLEKTQRILANPRRSLVSKKGDVMQILWKYRWSIVSMGGIIMFVGVILNLGARFLLMRAPKLPPLDAVGEIRRLEGHMGEVKGVAISPDSKWVLSVASDNMRLWDIEKGKEVRRFDCEKGRWGIQSVAFSPDGRFAMSGGRDPQLWDVETGQEIRRFPGHSELGVFGVGFSPDGKRAISGDTDGTIRLWDIQTGKKLYHFGMPAPTGTPGGEVGFLADGKHAYYNGILFDVETEKGLFAFFSG